MDYLKRAEELKEEIVRDRRYLHQHPELGCDLPVTSAYVEKRLKEIGLEVSHCGKYGLTALVGGKKQGKVLLLRADMDALGMTEESGLDYASLNPGKAHCCGHDNHTAMLLGAARLLKETEDELCGTVKLMFQPGEECGTGCLEMLAAGVLEQPKPDAAMGMHVDAMLPLGTFGYGMDAVFSSNDVFEITVKGVSCHGARPHQGKDPINAAAHIVTALETLIAREADPSQVCILTVGSIESSTKAFNIIPDSVTMKGSIRTYSEYEQKMLVRRTEETVEYISRAFGCEGIVSWATPMVPLLVDNTLESEMLSYLKAVLGDQARVCEQPVRKLGSEDFANLTGRVPSAFFFIGAGPDREHGGAYSQHNARVVFNEDMLPLGSAAFAGCAAMWLRAHAQAGK